MKVLIVDAYARTSKRRHQFVNFRRQVLKAIRAVDSRHDIDPMEIRVSTRSRVEYRLGSIYTNTSCSLLDQTPRCTRSVSL